MGTAWHRRTIRSSPPSSKGVTMGDIRKRLDRLDRLESGRGSVVSISGLAGEVREIDERIRCLDREIAEELVTLSPEEAEEFRRDAYISTLRGLSLDEAIACLDSEISEIRG